MVAAGCEGGPLFAEALSLLYDALLSLRMESRSGGGFEYRKAVLCARLVVL